MALFRLEAKIFSREKRGRSVIAAAAYRTGTKLRDENNEKTYDYSRRQKGIIQSVILAPDGAPDWSRQSESLWNTVERGEKRVDAQLAREFILALPVELDEKQQWETAIEWAQRELVNRGMIAEVSLHHSKDGRNPHVHILCTLRKVEQDSFCSKKAREWNEVALLTQQRESWASAVNRALARAGSEERVDHRSLKERGIDRLPEPKIGPEATAMKRKGLIQDSPRFERVRYTKLLNEMRSIAQGIRSGLKEIDQVGMGRTWWERSVCFLSHVKEQAVAVTKDAWQKYLDYRSVKEGKDGPDLSR